MLYLLLLKFTLFLLLCAWLTLRNDLHVALWSDEELIESLPRYLDMQKCTNQSYNFNRFADLDSKIEQIKSETSSRFKYDRVKAAMLDYGNKCKLIRSLESKCSRAEREGNDFAKSLIKRQIQGLVTGN